MRLWTRDPLSGMSPDEGAAFWRVRWDRAELAPRDQEAFAAWIAASTTNERAWNRGERVWTLFDQQDDEHVRAMRTTALADPGQGSWKPPRQAAAAFTLLAVPAALLYALTQSSPQPSSQTASRAPAAATAKTQVYQTRRGERLHVTLADETVMTLDTDTAVEVGFERTRRSVHLKRGQALFEVAKDTSRPFIVKVAGREVQALGTVFDVSLNASTLKVVLVEGRVAVTASVPGRVKVVPVMLKPGQSFTEQRGRQARVTMIDTEAALLWRDGLISLNDVTLIEAVAELNRYSSRQVFVRDPEIGAMRVSGVFRTGTPERFVNSIAEILPIAGRETGVGFEIVDRRHARASSPT